MRRTATAEPRPSPQHLWFSALDGGLQGEYLGLDKFLQTNILSVLPLMNFAGHETFPFRYNWLTKGYTRVAGDAQALGHLEDTMKELGLGKNMARSLRHWMLATQMCEMVDPPRGRQLRPTPLAHLLLDDQAGADRFLEDPGTLWLIHWSLCANPVRSTTWHVGFSLLREREFTKQGLAEVVERFARANGSGVARSTINRDVDCFVQCYIASESRKQLPDDSLACPLVELDLIKRLSTGRGESFEFARGPQSSLHDLVFASALTDHWKKAHATAMSLSFDQLAYGPGSPGMVLKLDENSLAMRLDTLETLTDGLLRFTEGAGIRQLARTDDVPSSEGFLHNYYVASHAG